MATSAQLKKFAVSCPSANKKRNRGDRSEEVVIKGNDMTCLLGNRALLGGQCCDH
jgi:hypothetical protein